MNKKALSISIAVFTPLAFVMQPSHAAQLFLIDAVNDTGTINANATMLGVNGSDIIKGVGNSKVFLTANQSGSETSELAYNTGGSVQFETIDSGTTALMLSELPIYDIGGKEVRAFGIAVNQTGGSSELSINEIQIFQTDTANTTGYDTVTRKLAGNAAIFDWNGGNDYFTVDDFASGLNTIEAVLLVDNSLFGTEKWVHFLFEAGDTNGGYTANDGPDKWITDERICGGTGTNVVCVRKTDMPPVPIPAAAWLFGSAMIGLAGFGRRRQKI